MHVSQVCTRATSLRGTGARLPCRHHREPLGRCGSSGLVPVWGWGCIGVPFPTSGGQGGGWPLGAGRWAPQSCGHAPPKTLLKEWLGSCFLAPRDFPLPLALAPSRFPGVSPAGRGGGNCAAVCPASFLLVAQAVTKGLLGPGLLRGFGTLLPIFGAGAGRLCVRHDPVATTPPAPWAAETMLALLQTP